MIESNRGRFMYLHTVVVVLVLYGMLLSSSSSSFTGTREKSYDEELFLFEFFQFFLSQSVSLLIAISLRGSVARIYESKKNTNNNRLL